MQTRDKSKRNQTRNKKNFNIKINSKIKYIGFLKENIHKENKDKRIFKP